MAAALLAALAALAVALAAACADDEPADITVQTPAATATATGQPVTEGVEPARPEPRASEAPPPIRTGPPRYGAWLIDVDAGEHTVLMENDGSSWPVVWVSRESVWVVDREEQVATHYAFDGSVLERIDDATWVAVSADGSGHLHVPVSGEAVVVWNGTKVTGAPVGLFSPDSSRLLYNEFSGLEREFPARYDILLFDLATETTTTVAEGLAACHCDTMPPPHTWSPSGRYILYPTLDGMYVFDTADGSTQQVLAGRRDGQHVVDGLPPATWSPATDVLVLPLEEGPVQLLDLGAGTRTPVGGADVGDFPLWFDPTGEYVYWFEGGETIVVALDGSIVTRWEGDGPVVATPDGLAVALAGTASCDGRLVRHPSLAGGRRCIEGAQLAVWSPDGSRLAVIMPSDQPGREIWVLDTESDELRSVASGVGGPIVELIWLNGGTHLLVRWPVETGV